MTELVLITGANLGNAVENLTKAYYAIEESIGHIIKHSAVYESSAWGFDSDDTFYNQVIVCLTDLTPEEVLSCIWTIETSLGKTRGTQEEEISKKERIENGIAYYQSRYIDIDILFYGNEIIRTKLLTIPHKHLEARRFVLKPLCEIMGEYIHPVIHKTLRTLLNELEQS